MERPSPFMYRRMLVLSLFIAAFIPVTLGAQAYKTVHGFYGATGNPGFPDPSPISSDYYNYSYPDLGRLTANQFGGGSSTRSYTEFIITSADLTAAGMSAGTLHSISLCLMSNGRLQSGNVKIFLSHTDNTTLGHVSGTQRGYPYYYTHNIQRIAVGVSGAVQPYEDAVLVADQPYNLPVKTGTFSSQQGPSLLQNGQWINWEFNQSTFEWDGQRNIVVGLFYCDPTGAYQFGQGPSFLATHVRPPERGTSNTTSSAWQTFYSNSFTRRFDCSWLGSRLGTLRLLLQLPHTSQHQCRVSSACAIPLHWGEHGNT